MGNLFRFFPGFPNTISSSPPQKSGGKRPDGFHRSYSRHNKEDKHGVTPTTLKHKAIRLEPRRSNSNRKTISICTHAVELPLVSCEIIWASMVKNFEMFT